jgi:hypothetical protein
MLELDVVLDLFIEFFGVASVGEHRPREFFRECLDPSASLHIDFEPTQEVTNRQIFVVERSVFASLRHGPDPVPTN